MMINRSHAGRGLQGRAADAVGVVRLDREHDRLAADLLCQRGEHERVRVVELAPRDVGADRPYLVAGRQHRHDRFAPDEHLGHARGTAGGDVDGAQSVTLEEEELIGDDVLADRPHVLVGRDLGPELGASIREPDVLAHHHGVESVGERIPGVDHLVSARGDQDRRAIAGTGRVRCPHGDAVHGRGVEGGRRPQSPHRSGRDPADGLGQEEAAAVPTRSGHEAFAHAGYQASSASATVVMGRSRPGERDHVSFGEGFLGVLAHPVSVQRGDEMRAERHADRLGGGSERGRPDRDSPREAGDGSRGCRNAVPEGRLNGPFAEPLDLNRGRRAGRRRLVLVRIVQVRHRLESRVEACQVRVGEKRRLVELPPVARLEEGRDPEPIGGQAGSGRAAPG